MIQEEIRRFLDGEGFYTWGIELLRQLGHDEKVVRRLAGFCKMAYAPTAAENELEEILRGYEKESSPQKELQIVDNESIANKNAPKSVEKDSNRPQRIREIEDDKVKLLKLRADWHTRMKVTQRQTDRAHCAEMVLKVQRDLDKVYATLDNYYQYGIEPIEVMNVEGNEFVNLVNSKGNLASRISKIRGLLKQEVLSEMRKEKLKLELSEKEVKFNEVNLKLKSV